MATKKNTGKSAGPKSGKKSRQAQEQARAREQEKQAEAARKSRQMGNVFLYSLLSLVGVFCLYALIRTLFLPANSLPELRENYLFISLISIPYLIAAVAVILRKVRRKRRIEASDRVRRAENLLFLVVLLAAFAMFGIQMASGRTELADHTVLVTVDEALAESGLPVESEEAIGFRTALEALSAQRKITCGSVEVTLNYHQAGSWILNRFRQQAAALYAELDEAQTQRDGVAVSLRPAEADPSGKTAVICAHTGRALLILELKGPAEQVNQLRPLLLEAAGKALGG